MQTQQQKTKTISLLFTPQCSATRRRATEGGKCRISSIASCKMFVSTRMSGLHEVRLIARVTGSFS